MAREKFSYSGNGELFALAAQVNAFCETTPDDFDPTIHISEARTIVETIDPRIKKSSGIRVSTWGKRKGTSIKGATEHGDISISTDTTPYEKSFGGKEYRIGNYVVTKMPFSFGRSSLYFQHFWEREPSSRVVDTPTSYRRIVYQKKTLDPIAIAQVDYPPKTVRLGHRTYTLYAFSHRTTLWKK